MPTRKGRCGATEPGGSYDTYGRLVARHLARHLGLARAVVKNVPGGGHIRGANEIASSRADGLTRGTFNTGLIYASRIGLEIRTREVDMLTFDDAPYDVICAHSFLGRFDPESRRMLLRRWHALLRPGGRIITSLRIRPGSPRSVNGFSAVEVEELVHRVRRAAAERHDLETPAWGDLSATVRQYAAAKTSHVTRDAEGLLETVREAGFSVEAAWQEASDARRASSPAASGCFRLQLVAGRRRAS